MRNDGQAGILFADISGSTRIYEMLGDERAHRVVRETLRRASEPIAANGGTVVKTIGDELMAAFRSPDGAFKAAVGIQRAMQAGTAIQTGAAPLRLAFRIGFHFGPAVLADGDYFGDTVNVAARIVGLAKAGQILTTGEVLESLNPADRACGVEFGRVEVKGRSDPVRVVQVEWSVQPQNQTVLRFAAGAEEDEKQSSLRIVYEGRTWHVPMDRKAVSCGRDGACDLVLKGSQASRNHATIERRRGKVMLIDHSTNGTHLIVDHQAPTRLHREEFALARQGCIVFGSLDREQADTLWFFFA